MITYKVAIGYFQPTISSMTFIGGTILLAIGIAVPAKAILGTRSTQAGNNRIVAIFDNN